MVHAARELLGYEHGAHWRFQAVCRRFDPVGPVGPGIFNDTHRMQRILRWFRELKIG
jgi:hypothetical protein